MKREASRAGGPDSGPRTRSVAWTLAMAATWTAMCATPLAAQGGGPLDLGPGEDGRSRVQAALHGAAVGVALSVPPVVLTSGTAEDVGIAALLGVTAGGAAGVLLPSSPGEQTNRWKGALLGLGAGAVVGGLTLAVAWNDPSIEFDTRQKLGVGAVAGGALGAIVGAVLGAGSGRQDAGGRTVRLGLSPQLRSPGRWSGFVSIAVGLPSRGRAPDHAGNGRIVRRDYAQLSPSQHISQKRSS